MKEKLEIDGGPFLKEERNLIDAIAERLGHVIERMRSRSALQESDDRLRILYNNSPDMYASVSAHDAKILMCNETLLKKTGYSREELIGFPIFKIYPDNRMADAKKASQKLVKGKIIEDKELTLKRKDGSKIEASLNVNAIKDEAGRVKYSMCSWRDITDAKRAEKDKEKMVRLESLGVLAGGIAHDFNNLLAVIMGNVSIALQKEGKEKREVLQKVLKAIEKTTGLSNQLLTFAKGGRPSIQVTSMSKIIEESLNLNLGKSSEHSCETIFQDDLWPIEVDENQIGQVFQNLLINAKQAMPEGGTINIEAKNIVDPIAVGSGNYIHVSVRDAGIGIPEKYLSKIFDPYFSTKQKEGGGTGLGLAVSHSIIRKHNGLINAESEPGIGTLFNIFLPASKKQILEEEVVLEEDEVHKSLKILVMDDEELIREMVGDMLSAIGHRCKSVKDGKEAIEAYKNALDSEPFDLVILDLTIPGGMGGVETLSYLKKLDKGVIVIVSSGYADELPEGFKVALPKPYNVKSLKEVLDKISK